MSINSTLKPLSVLDHLGSERKWPSPHAEKWVLTFAAQACRTADLEALVLIGSIARPVRQVADVDLLYVYHHGSVSFQDHPLDVDIRAYEKSKFLERLTCRHDVITWALRYGRLICERDHFWSDLVDSFGGNLPLPPPEVAEERAERTAVVYKHLLEMGDREAALEQRISLLTHRAWVLLLRAKVHPASRPELPAQLRSINEQTLATDLESALAERDSSQRIVVVHNGVERRAG